MTPWINVNPNYVNINAQQLKDTKSIFNYYKEMVRLRNSSEYGKTLIYGDFQAIVTKEDDLKDGKIILNNRVVNDSNLCPYQTVVKEWEK